MLTEFPTPPSILSHSMPLIRTTLHTPPSLVLGSFQTLNLYQQVPTCIAFVDQHFKGTPEIRNPIHNHPHVSYQLLEGRNLLPQVSKLPFEPPKAPLLIIKPLLELGGTVEAVTGLLICCEGGGDQ
ncbi:hypothetical protein B9Z19DRAFT_1138311 [Tuber borchii]|uniref:Uncharacterized protein n=1 Tax=Tuber borchii TaxID=42251 RepID=A0A2T6Z9U6_TUBBO|nr:hypothetical protein B9Z19DRAFT_1138311 [Tuber borchii]